MPRTQPNNVAAEAGILGGIMLRNAVLGELPDLEPGDFYDPRHRIVFTAIRNLEEAKRPIDELTLEDAIRNAGYLDAIGGIAFLGELRLRTSTADNVVEYSKLVRMAAAARAMIATCSEIVERGHEADLDIVEYISEAEARVSATAALRRDADGARTMKQVMKDAGKRIGQRYDDRSRGNPVSMLGVPTGCTELDAYIGGWSRGVVNLGAARPAMGKTSLGMASADACALAGEGVHVFSMEDPETVYAERAIARRSGMPAKQIEQAEFTNGSWSDFMRAAGGLRRHENWLLDNRGWLTSREIVAEVRRHRGKNKTGLVIIDYVQKVRKNPRLIHNENLAIDEIMTDFAAAATEDGGRVAWLVLCQLNRETEKRDSQHPRLSDLRGSGSLEEKSKLIVGLYRGFYYRDKPQRGVDYFCSCDPRDGDAPCQHTPSGHDFERTMQLHILKKNMGETGIVLGRWDGPTLTVR